MALFVTTAGEGIRERAEELKMKVFTRKKAQLEAVQPEAIISACSNCRIMFEEGLEEYHMDIPMISLTETLAEHLEGNEKTGS